MKPPTRRQEWFDDDAFWRDCYQFMFPEKRFAEARELVGKALALAKPPGRCVLDLCCGPGRWAIPLAQRGLSVTGVDRTRFLLDTAKRKARAVQVKIEWVQADMRDFVRPVSFDLALSLFTSFGYFDDKQEDLGVLRNVLASLKPAGVFLMDMMGKEILARIFQPTTSEVLPDGNRFVERHQILDGWTRVRNEWMLIRPGRVKTFRFHHTIYSGQELRDRLDAAGFADVKLYGNWNGDEYGPTAQRLIAVVRKAGIERRNRRRQVRSRTATRDSG